MKPALNPLAAPALIALAAVGVSGCTEPEPTLEKYYDAYPGEAYPSSRPKVNVPPAGMGVVTDSRSDTISLIDLATGKRFAAYPVGREPVTIDGPHHIAADQTRGFFYTALSYPPLSGAAGPHASHGSSAVPGYAQKLAMDDLRVVGQVRVEANPGEVVLSQDGKRLVVSHYDLQRALEHPGDLTMARSDLALIDPDTMALAGSAPATMIRVCIAAHGVALSRPDGATAYVACYGEDSLAVVNLADPSAEPELIPVGADAETYSPTYGPYSTVMSPDGKTIAVGSTASKDVRFFDVATKTFDLSKTIKTQGAPYFMAFSPDGGRLYIPTQQPDAMLLVDLTQDNAELAYRDLSGACERPHVANFDGGAGLFLVCEGDQTNPGSVLMLNATTLNTLGDSAVGVYPDAFIRVGAGASK